MRLKSPTRLRNSLALRVTIWYGVTFLLIASSLSIISFYYLSKVVRDNRKVIHSKLQEVSAVVESHGVDSIERYIRFDATAYGPRSVLVRVIDANGHISFQSHPALWQEFVGVSPAVSLVGSWQYVPSSKDRDVLELTTAALPGGYLLQVGKEIQDRKEILEHYRDTIIGVTTAMIVIGLAGGAFLAFRALEPVRTLARITHGIVTTGDISARVPEARAGGELEDLTRLFNRMLERIETLITRMRDTLDNVAHDLRTPVARFRAVAEMALQSDNRPDLQREALISSVEESDRILALLNNLMDISEAESGTMRLRLENVEVPRLIRESVGLYEYIAEEKNISIAVQCPPQVSFTGDCARMRQVLVNLLDNAIKYTGLSGHVWIHASQRDGEVAISVRDDGCGIIPEETPRIWERLHRGDRSRSQPGLGLGLSLVRAIVEAHHGRVDVRSTPGQGTTFTVFVPAQAAGV